MSITFEKRSMTLEDWNCVCLPLKRLPKTSTFDKGKLQWRVHFCMYKSSKIHKKKIHKQWGSCRRRETLPISHSVHLISPSDLSSSQPLLHNFFVCIVGSVSPLYLIEALTYRIQACNGITPFKHLESLILWNTDSPFLSTDYVFFPPQL